MKTEHALFLLKTRSHWIAPGWLDDLELPKQTKLMGNSQRVAIYASQGLGFKVCITTSGKKVLFLIACMCVSVYVCSEVHVNRMPREAKGVRPCSRLCWELSLLQEQKVLLATGASPLL